MATRKTTAKKPAAKGKAKTAKRSTAAASGKTVKSRTSAPKAKSAATGKKAPARAGKRKAQSAGESFLLAQSAVNGILEKKGENIVCLDLRGIENAVCDYFIICEANSNIQVEAIADSVEQTVKKELHERPYRSEGWENALWILIDYVSVVVHVFQRETRQFYNLESLWADAETVDFGKKEKRA